MASRRNIDLQAVTIGFDIIPLGGEDESARITFGDQIAVTRGPRSTVFSDRKNPDVLLTITCLPEDDTHRVLRQREQLRKATVAALRTPQAGVAVNAENGERVTWSDCECLNYGDLMLGQGTGTVTWVYALSGVTPSQGAGL